MFIYLTLLHFKMRLTKLLSVFPHYKFPEERMKKKTSKNLQVIVYACEIKINVCLV